MEIRSPLIAVYLTKFPYKEEDYVRFLRIYNNQKRNEACALFLSFYLYYRHFNIMILQPALHPCYHHFQIIL